jgi:UDP-N-acetylmuramoylalanine--D-glutamate ligase
VKIAVLGYGKQGKSAVEYWNSTENQITVCDLNSEIELPDYVSSRLGLDYLDDLSDFDLIVRSPNVKPNDIVSKNGSEILSKVTTPTIEFLKVCPTQNVVGVTGSKGKGTTCSLILEMLKKMGKKAYLGGNFGISPLDLLKEDILPTDWVILELANFQLIDLNISPHIAVCLMIAPEHLDWHGSMDDYVASKSNIFKYQNTEDIAIYYADNELSKGVASLSKGKKIPFFKAPGALVADGNFEIEGNVICSTKELKILGEHNWQNVCAAITAVWQINQDIESIRQALLDFNGLEHRLELVRVVDQVSYFNDSFGSMPDATIASLGAIHGKKIVIIGGFDRMLPLGDLAKTIKNDSGAISKILLIGASKDRVAAELDRVGFDNYEKVESKDIGEIVKRARELSQPNDSVVFSPGFPSFDMFKNFEDRGNRYKAEVSLL